jgi:hypothetical protein
MGVMTRRNVYHQSASLIGSLQNPTLVTAPGAGSIVVPSGVTSLTVEAWGGGCGGNSASAPNGCSGAGGGYAKSSITVTPGQTVFYNVGDGGIGATPPTQNGTAGGDSWVNKSTNSAPGASSNGCLATGGAAGDTSGFGAGSGTVADLSFSGGVRVSSNNGAGGGGGAGSGGDGGFQVTDTVGGAGGSPDGGRGGDGFVAGATDPGDQPGGGGGGTWASGGGSNGAAGKIKISWLKSSNVYSIALKNAEITLSNGALTVDMSAAASMSAVSAVDSASSGKYYWETTVVGDGGGNLIVGATSPSFSYNGGNYVGRDTFSLGYDRDNRVLYNNGTIATLVTYTAGDIIGVALDITNSKIWFRKNGGDWNNDVIGNQNPATNTGGYDISTLTADGAVRAAISLHIDADQVTTNFGATAFSQTAPSGFTKWP